MRRLISFAIAFAAAVSFSTGALAANIVAERVPFDNSVLTTPVLDPATGLPLYTDPGNPGGTTTDPDLGGDPITTPTPDECPAPCYQVNLYWQDHTRALQVTAIQFDLDVIGGTPAVLAVPPATNDTSGNGNAFDPGPAPSGIKPWDLSATVGKSPTAGFDVLVVLAATPAWTVNSLALAFPNNTSTTASCAGQATCDELRAGLAVFNATTNPNPIDGIYLGWFLATFEGSGIRISPPIGNYGTGARPPGGECTFGTDNRCTVPEPSSVLILGIALAGLGALRRRTTA